MTSSHNVRLTTRAHRLCAEEAKRRGTSMRAVASEAIFLFAGVGEKATYEDKIVKKKLFQELVVAKRRGLYLLIAATIVAGCMGIFIGMML